MSLIKKSEDHLKGIRENYWEHFSFAMVFAIRLQKAAIGVFVHALIPAWFQYTGSNTVKQLYEELCKRLRTHHEG